MLDCLKILGVAAITPAIQEIRFGLNEILTMAAERDIPVVATNLSRRPPTTARPDSAGPSPSWLSHLIAPVGAARVAVVSALDPENFLDSGGDARRFEVTDPARTLAPLVTALADSADYVVALLAMEVEAARELLTNVGPVDVAVISIPERTPRRPQRIGSCWLVDVGDYGRFIGKAALHRPRERPATAELVRGIEESEEILRRVGVLIRQQDHRSRAHRSAQGADDREQFDYVGAETCARCHEPAYRAWSRSPHARAFDTLVERGFELDAECVGCHVTGFGRPGGFATSTSYPDLRGVQCEACHGPGRDHTRGGRYRTGYNACVHCHAGEGSEDFDPDIAYARLAHEEPDWPELHDEGDPVALLAAAPESVATAPSTILMELGTRALMAGAVDLASQRFERLIHGATTPDVRGEALNRLFTGAVMAGDEMVARGLLNRAIEENRADGLHRMLVRNLIRLARLAREAADTTTAARLLNEAVVVNTGHLRGLGGAPEVDLGLYYTMTGKDELTTFIIDDLTARRQRVALAELRGWTALYHGRPADAVRAFGAIAEDDLTAWSATGLAQAYVGLGHADSAATVLESSLAGWDDPTGIGTSPWKSTLFEDPLGTCRGLELLAICLDDIGREPRAERVRALLALWDPRRSP